MVEDKEQSEKAASERKIADNKKKKQKAEENKDADLSEEDLELKNNLLLMVTRIGDGETGVQKLALQQVANEIRSATTSMTSVPKPLKFLRAHYQTLVDVFDKTSDEEVKRQLADVLSVLAITTAKEGERACLKYRLLGSKVGTSTCFKCSKASKQSGTLKYCFLLWRALHAVKHMLTAQAWQRSTAKQPRFCWSLCRMLWLHGVMSIYEACQGRLGMSIMRGERRKRACRTC